MFPKKYRLAKTKDVKATFAQGRTFFNPFLTIKFRPAQHYRFTVVVSTKVAKKAVVRNRLKRIISEDLKQHMTAVRPGDYAIILKNRAAMVEEKDVKIMA